MAQSSESFGAASMEQFYVSASRGKEAISIYTDDKEQLLRSVQESSQRLSATELVDTQDRTQEKIREIEQIRRNQRLQRASVARSQIEQPPTKRYTDKEVARP